MKSFHLTIARVNGPLFDAEAVSVTVPGSEGEFTVLAGHEPLISPLRAGSISVRRADEEIESFEVQERGTLEVSGNRVSILL